MPAPHTDQHTLIHQLLNSILSEVSTERSKAEQRHESIIQLLEKGRGGPCVKGVLNDEAKPDKKYSPQVGSCVEKVTGPKPTPTTSPEEMSVGIDPADQRTFFASGSASSHSLSDTPQSKTDTEVMKVRKKQLELLGVSGTHAHLYNDELHKLSHWERARRIVEHETVESVVCLLIVLNAMIMGFEMQLEGYQIGYYLEYDGYSQKPDLPSARVMFMIADWFFGTAFLLESLAKVAILSRRYFLQLWNLVDFICVLAFVSEKIAATFLPIRSTRLRVMRIFRLVRLFRVIHKLEMLETLYTMTKAINATFSILLWSMALLTCIVSAFALFLAHGLQASYFDESAIEHLSEIDQQHTDMFKYFGTFTRCLFSMFELTLANWTPVARILSEEVSEWFQLLCVLHKIIIGFAVVGVINGIVMKETFKVADTDDTVMIRAKQREKKRIEEKMHKFFGAIDTDGSDSVDLEEFISVARGPEVKLWLNSLDVETDDLVALFRVLDKDQDGVVSLAELTSRLPRVKGPARSIDVVTMAAHVTTQWERQHLKRKEGSRTSDIGDH